MMNELSEKELETLNRTRQIRAESDVLRPLLDTKQAMIVAKIIQAFKSGKHEHLTALAAELTAVHDMKYEIDRSIKTAAQLERKAFQNADTIE